MKIPAEWRPLAVKTVVELEKIDKQKGREPLTKSIMEFAQLLMMLSVFGGKEFDGGDDHEHDDRRDQDKH